jgi:MFS family permease
MLLAKSFMALVSVFIVVLQILNMHSLQSLLILSFSLGFLNAIHHPIRLVFISLIVPRPYLSSAIGLNSVSFSMSRIVGPGLAGISIASLGLGVTFGIASLLYLPFILTLIWLPLQERQSEGKTKENFITRLRDGGVVALQTPIIFMALSIVALNSFFVRGVLEIQPAIIGQILGGGSRSLAVATAAAGVGAIVASGWIGVGKMESNFIRRLLWPGLAVGLVSSLMLSQAVELFWMSVVFVICGFTATLVGIGSQTIVQLTVEDRYRARVMAWWSSFSFGGVTLGGLLIGFIGDFIAINIAISVVGFFGFLLALAVLGKQPLARFGA